MCSDIYPNHLRRRSAVECGLGRGPQALRNERVLLAIETLVASESRQLVHALRE